MARVRGHLRSLQIKANHQPAEPNARLATLARGLLIGQLRDRTLCEYDSLCEDTTCLVASHPQTDQTAPTQGSSQKSIN